MTGNHYELSRNSSKQRNTKYPCQPSKTVYRKTFRETKNMTQAEWLEVRRKGIGSSDCAAAWSQTLICRCWNCG
jgi:hypothetical protein